MRVPPDRSCAASRPDAGTTRSAPAGPRSRLPRAYTPTRSASTPAPPRDRAAGRPCGCSCSHGLPSCHGRDDYAVSARCTTVARRCSVSGLSASSRMPRRRTRSEVSAKTCAEGRGLSYTFARRASRSTAERDHARTARIVRGSPRHTPDSAYGIEALAFDPMAGGADLANAVFRVTAVRAPSWSSCAPHRQTMPARARTFPGRHRDRGNRPPDRDPRWAARNISGPWADRLPLGRWHPRDVRTDERPALGGPRSWAAERPRCCT